MSLKFCYEGGEKLGLPIDEAATTYYPGKVSSLTTGDLKMMRRRKVLFAFMSRTAATPAAYFDLPVTLLVELGAQVQVRYLFPSPGNFTQQNERSPHRQTAAKKE
jgi:K+ transporter